MARLPSPTVRAACTLLVATTACLDPGVEGVEVAVAPPGVTATVAVGGSHAGRVAYRADGPMVEVRELDGTLIAQQDGDYASLIARPDQLVLVDPAPGRSRAIELDGAGALIRGIADVPAARYLPAGDDYLTLTPDGDDLRLRWLDRNFALVDGAAVIVPADAIVAARAVDLVVVHDEGGRRWLARYARSGQHLGDVSFAYDRIEAVVAGADGYLVISVRGNQRLASVVRDTGASDGSAIGDAIGPLAAAPALSGFGIATVSADGGISVRTIDLDGHYRSGWSLGKPRGVVHNVSLARVADHLLVTFADESLLYPEVVVRAVEVDPTAGPGPVVDVARSPRR